MPVRRGCPEARSQGTAVVITHARRSAQLSGSVSTASPLCSAGSPSRPSVGLSHHPYIVVTAPPCYLLDARAASAPFFAPALRIRPILCPTPSPPPPFRTPCKSHCTHVRLFPPCVPRPSPSPSLAPAGVFNLLSIYCLGIRRRLLSASLCVWPRAGCCACLSC